GINSFNPWQSRRVSLQKKSEKRWKNNFWYPSWEELTQDDGNTRSLNLQIRTLQENLKSTKGKALASAWKKDGEVFNDGLGEDVIQREAVFVARDAFFPQ